jgi:hypothetical protein
MKTSSFYNNYIIFSIAKLNIVSINKKLIIAIRPMMPKNATNNCNGFLFIISFPILMMAYIKHNLN